MGLFNLKKFTTWEYWPSYMFYVPVVPYGLYLALKSKSFGFFSAVNPAIEGSGNGLESKYKTLQLVPKKYSPESIFVKKGAHLKDVLSKILLHHIEFPLIIKPDIGFRGLLVKKLNSEEELSIYIKKYNSINLIVQELIDYENECGIFYHKIPGENKGSITSITLKKYLTVQGDGESTLLELIKSDKRARIYIELISELNKDKLTAVPSKNEKLILNVIGNHSKGTQFINGNHLISEELTKILDNLSSDIEGWYYGRVDIKYHNFDKLLKGEHFKIIEVNGIISEPTHIYDATSVTYLNALKTIKEHWKLAYIIGVKNHTLNNIPFTNFRYLMNLYLRHKKYLRKVKDLSVK